MIDEIKKALQEVESKVYYGVGRFQGRTDWDCIVFGRRRSEKTASGAGKSKRWFVAMVKEDFIPEDMEEKVIKAMQTLGFKESSGGATYDYVEKTGETVVEIGTIEFVKTEKRCRE